jgi:hypothetical protein
MIKVDRNDLGPGHPGGPRREDPANDLVIDLAEVDTFV